MKVIKTIGVLCFAMLLVSGVNIAVADADRIYQIQKKRLDQPSSIVRKAEQLRQSIFIYEGMREQDVENAMEYQFDRIENMMFIKTRLLNEEGEEEVEEDGCD
jgi:hypothetical protein